MYNIDLKVLVSPAHLHWAVSELMSPLSFLCVSSYRFSSILQKKKSINAAPILLLLAMTYSLAMVMYL